MRYQVHTPAPQLPEGVRCLWTLQDDASTHPLPQRVVPDGCVELVINVADRFQQLNNGAGASIQPALLVVADARRPVVIAPTGRVDLVAIRFEPGGAAQFLGASMRELMDGTFDLRDVNNHMAGGLLEEVADARDHRARLAVVQRRLAERFIRRLAPDRRLLAAARVVSESRGRVRIDTLTRSMGVSNRWLQRRFKEAVGFGPKLLGRLSRFHSLVGALEGASAPQWARLAAEHGYYDQSHLIRDFRTFAGTSPGEFLREPNALNSLFTRS